MTMLRSRSNRQQRPSESTDERHGRNGSSSSSSSSYNYGGYPSSSSASPIKISIASGADEDDDYEKDKNKRRGGSSSSGRFGFGIGSGSNGVNKRSLSSSTGSGGMMKRGSNGINRNNNNGWGGSTADKRHGIGSINKGHPVKQNSGSVGSVSFILFAFSFIVIVAMGGATIHYRKMIDRFEHELAIMRGRTKSMARGHHADLMSDRFHEMKGPASDNDFDDDDDAKNNNDNVITSQQMAQIRATKSKLQGQSSKWSTKATSANHSILALTTQIEHLRTHELNSYRTQIIALTNRLAQEQLNTQKFRDEFISTHKKGEGGIVPGGPGHALVQRKEIEQMESLDDYEDYVQRREDALWSKIDVLVEKYGKSSQREAEEWFGNGIHKVELDIEYPQFTVDLPPSSWPRVRGTFTLEMAPLDLMPIAVNLFLQQVHHKLWNGCSFVINAMHILQAGPHRYDESQTGKYDANVASLVDGFQNAKLDKMPFQEYHENYPHNTHTVGFAGRPGGPDFYINKIDNSENHGPGGQSHHDLHEEADPCFGRLVGGIEILKELNKIPVDGERGSLLLHSVVIVDSRVVISGRPEAKGRQVGNAGNEDGNQQRRQLLENGDGNNNRNPNGESARNENEQNNDQGSNRFQANRMPAMGPGRI
mmetsp:Transcript_38905/g.81377  ORF Transcript_38905/g.81377 Transcript_38905/m.81377 type:complete len:650 (+) Transcript_38905:152-2101(+)